MRHFACVIGLILLSCASTLSQATEPTSRFPANTGVEGKPHPASSTSTSASPPGTIPKIVQKVAAPPVSTTTTTNTNKRSFQTKSDPSSSESQAAKQTQAAFSSGAPAAEVAIKTPPTKPASVPPKTIEQPPPKVKYASTPAAPAPNPSIPDPPAKTNPRANQKPILKQQPQQPQQQVPPSSEKTEAVITKAKDVVSSQKAAFGTQPKSPQPVAAAATGHVETSTKTSTKPSLKSPLRSTPATKESTKTQPAAAAATTTTTTTQEDAFPQQIKHTVVTIPLDVPASTTKQQSIADDSSMISEPSLDKAEAQSAIEPFSHPEPELPQSESGAAQAQLETEPFVQSELDSPQTEPEPEPESVIEAAVPDAIDEPQSQIDPELKTEAEPLSDFEPQPNPQSADEPADEPQRANELPEPQSVSELGSNELGSQVSDDGLNSDTQNSQSHNDQQAPAESTSQFDFVSVPDAGDDQTSQNIQEDEDRQQQQQQQQQDNLVNPSDNDPLHSADSSIADNGKTLPQVVNEPIPEQHEPKLPAKEFITQPVESQSSTGEDEELVAEVPSHAAQQQHGPSSQQQHPTTTAAAATTSTTSTTSTEHQHTPHSQPQQPQQQGAHTETQRVEFPQHQQHSQELPPKEHQPKEHSQQQQQQQQQPEAPSYQATTPQQPHAPEQPHTPQTPQKPQTPPQQPHMSPQQPPPQQVHQLPQPQQPQPQPHQVPQAYEPPPQLPAPPPQQQQQQPQFPTSHSPVQLPSPPPHIVPAHEDPASNQHKTYTQTTHGQQEFPHSPSQQAPPPQAPQTPQHLPPLPPLPPLPQQPQFPPIRGGSVPSQAVPSQAVPSQAVPLPQGQTDPFTGFGHPTPAFPGNSPFGPLPKLHFPNQVPKGDAADKAASNPWSWPMPNKPPTTSSSSTAPPAVDKATPAAPVETVKTPDVLGHFDVYPMADSNDFEDTTTSTSKPSTASNSEPEVVLPCSAHLTCESCTADRRCGYCLSSDSCLQGTAKGSSVGVCNNAWYFHSCPLRNFPKEKDPDVVVDVYEEPGAQEPAKPSHAPLHATTPHIVVPPLPDDSDDAPTSISTSMGMVVVVFAVFFFYRWKYRAQRIHYRELPSQERNIGTEDYTTFIHYDDDQGGHTYGPDADTGPRAHDPLGLFGDTFGDQAMPAKNTWTPSSNNPGGPAAGSGPSNIGWADWDADDKW